LFRDIVSRFQMAPGPKPFDGWSTKHAKSTKDPGKSWDSPRQNPLTGQFEPGKLVEILSGSLGFASIRVIRGHLVCIIPAQNWSDRPP